MPRLPRSTGRGRSAEIGSDGLAVGRLSRPRASVASTLVGASTAIAADAGDRGRREARDSSCHLADRPDLANH
jgi:hypothetical protein